MKAKDDVKYPGKRIEQKIRAYLKKNWRDIIIILYDKEVVDISFVQKAQKRCLRPLFFVWGKVCQNLFL